MNNFDDEDLVILLGDNRMVIYVTSWWRKLLFMVGINVYYKRYEFIING